MHFEPDPQSEYKRDLYLENGIDWTPALTPVPILEEWEYREVFEKGIRPLVEKESGAVARILANAAEGTIWLRRQEKSQMKGVAKTFLRHGAEGWGD